MIIEKLVNTIPIIILLRLQEEEFFSFLKEITSVFSEEMIEAGYFSDPKEAKKFSETLLREKFFTSGYNTVNQHIYHLIDTESQKKVGLIWYTNNFKMENEIRAGRVYFLEIIKKYRKKGYGLAAMKIIEENLEKERVATLTLNVFSRNVAAKRLYQKLGYEVVKKLEGKWEMRKKLKNHHE